MPKELAIIKTPGHSKYETMEAEGIQLAAAATKQATLNNHSVQSQECPLLSVSPADSVKDFLLQAQEIATKRRETDMTTKRGNF